MPRTPEMEELYRTGLAHFHAARWEDALTALRRLRDLGEQSAELDRMIAHAELKSEIARAAMPAGALPPQTKRPTVPRWAIGAAAGFIAIVVVAALLLRPADEPPAPVAAAPTPSPTRQAISVPTPTAAPAPPPTTPRRGTLVVQLAEGLSLSAAVPSIEIILDASGSMQARIDETPKIEIAHSALEALVRDLPEQTLVALRSYGHRRTADCSDIELITPLAPLDRDAFIAKVRGVRPVSLSRTPMEGALRAALEELRNVETETLVILVSDGDETCDGDPAQAAADLHAANPKVRVSVIGFDIGPDDWRARLQAIAERGGGSYFDAADAIQLAEALQQAVQLTYRVIDASGAPVFEGPVGAAAEDLPSGEYTVEIVGGSPVRLESVRVGGRPVTVEVATEDGALKATVVRR